jgi:hypothetical protein
LELNQAVDRESERKKDHNGSIAVMAGGSGGKGRKGV